MDAVKILDQHQQPDIADIGPNATVTREMEAILEEAEQSEAADRPEVRHWFYSVPCAGVRYYSF
jgi:hypothetical protein